jgi:hypothetical protein
VLQLGGDVDHNPQRKQGNLLGELSLAYAAGWDFGGSPIKVISKL